MAAQVGLSSRADDVHLSGVSFTDANTGTAVGDHGTILRTTNGGASWTAQSSGTTNWLMASLSPMPTPERRWENAEPFFARPTAAQVGLAQSSGTTVQLSGVSFTDANTGTAVG